MCKQSKQKYLLKVWGSLCAGHFSPLRKIHLQFCSHISQGACRAIIPSHCQSWLSPGTASCTQATLLGDLQLAESGRAQAGYGSALQPKEAPLAGTRVAANCSATALHLSAIPTMCSDTPSCAPYAEDMNVWPCTFLAISFTVEEAVSEAF